MTFSSYYRKVQQKPSNRQPISYNSVVGFQRLPQFMPSKNLLAYSCIVVVKGGTNSAMVATVAILHSIHLVHLTSDLQQYPVT